MVFGPVGERERERELANEAIETEKLRKKREESYRHRENRIIDDQAGVWRPAAKANSASVSV